MLPSTTFICFVICMTHFQTINSQTCTNGLTSPPELIWTPSPTLPHIPTTTLTFDVSTKTWNNNAISLTTRLYNNMLGGPTMRMQRGKTYKITLINNLGPERSENSLLTGNQEHDPNTTNLHTHGAHISPMDPGDHVFPPIYPGGNASYTYNIPCTHSGGIHWYHAHHHPSVQLHVGGGAAGAIIIEDDAIAEGLPDWYTNMRELIFFVNHIDLHFFRFGYPDRTQAQKDNQIILKLIPNDKDLYIVNGQYQPTVCQSVDEWIRFRFIQTEVRDPQRYKIGNNNDCTLKLLAKDGVIIQNPPRDVGNIVWLSEASRADVAITCIEGIHSITAINDNFGDIIIAYIHVSGEPINQFPIELTPFQPIRPPYLRDLSNAVVSNSLSMQMFHDGIVINNGIKQKFGVHATPWFQGVDNIKIDSVNEWTLTPQPIGIGYWHPLHIHINHFQIINGPPNNQLPVSWQQHLLPPVGYQQVGDYVDTLWGPGVIRFRADLWGGPMLVHCHRLEHEVGGAMGSFIIENGCDAMYNDFSGTNTCTFDTNCAPTLEPSTGFPSMTPTSNPSIDLPSEIPTWHPTYSPSVYPTHIPTNIPTKTPSINPTVYPSVTPSNNPTNIPSLYPTLLPSNNPTITPTNIPTVIPTYNPTIEPTYIPTLYPTNEPTLLPTLYPTNGPTIQPTNNPTDWIPNELTCNNEITGSYDNKIIYFKINLPYNGNLIFDASDSDFKMKALTAFEKDNINGGFFISTNKNTLRINNLTIGDYFVSIEGKKDNYGIFNVIITCEELNQDIILLSTDVIMYAEIKSDNFIINHIAGIYAIIGVLSFGLGILIMCNCFIYLRSKCKKRGLSKSGHMRVDSKANVFGKNSINTPDDTNDINDYQEDEIIHIVQELTAPTKSNV